MNWSLCPDRIREPIKSWTKLPVCFLHFKLEDHDFIPLREYFRLEGIYLGYNIKGKKMFFDAFLEGKCWLTFLQMLMRHTYTIPCILCHYFKGFQWKFQVTKCLSYDKTAISVLTSLTCILSLSNFDYYFKGHCQHF